MQKKLSKPACQGTSQDTPLLELAAFKVYVNAIRLGLYYMTRYLWFIGHVSENGRFNELRETLKSLPDGKELAAHLEDGVNPKIFFDTAKAAVVYFPKESDWVFKWNGIPLVDFRHVAKAITNVLSRSGHDLDDLWKASLLGGPLAEDVNGIIDNPCDSLLHEIDQQEARIEYEITEYLKRRDAEDRNARVRYWTEIPLPDGRIIQISFPSLHRSELEKTTASQPSESDRQKWRENQVLQQAKMDNERSLALPFLEEIEHYESVSFDQPQLLYYQYLTLFDSFLEYALAGAGREPLPIEEYDDEFYALLASIRSKRKLLYSIPKNLRISFADFIQIPDVRPFASGVSVKSDVVGESAAVAIEPVEREKKRPGDVFARMKENDVWYSHDFCTVYAKVDAKEYRWLLTLSQRKLVEILFDNPEVPMTHAAIQEKYERADEYEVSRFRLQDYFKHRNSEVLGTLIVSPKPGRFQINPVLTFRLLEPASLQE